MSSSQTRSPQELTHALADSLISVDASKATGWDPQNLSSEETRVLNLLLLLCRAIFGAQYDDYDIFHHNSTEDPHSPNWPFLIPVGNDLKLELLNSLLRRTVLYAERSVAVLPRTLVFDEVGIKWVGDVPSRSEGRHISLQSLVRLNKQYQRLVASDLCVFLPQHCKSAYYLIGSDYQIMHSEAPMRQRADLIELFPLNMVHPNARIDHSILVYKELLLPFFSNIDLNTMAKIARNETASFSRFNGWMTRKVAELMQSETENRFEELILELEDGVAEIRLEAEKISKLRALEGAELTTFILSLAGMIDPSQHALKGVATITGSATLFGLTKQFIERKQQKASLKKSALYVPYLMTKS
jgi:hypothetical protein